MAGRYDQGFGQGCDLGYDHCDYDLDYGRCGYDLGYGHCGCDLDCDHCGYGQGYEPDHDQDCVVCPRTKIG